MSRWLDDLARDLGHETHRDHGSGRRTRRSILRNLLGSVAAASPLTILGALPVAAAKCKNNKECGANKRCRDGKCEPDRCKNNNDCGPNKRCRNGDCEQIAETGGGDNNEKWENPGTFSREQGVKEWKLDRQGGGYTVEFRHQNERFSGTLDINYDAGGRTGTTTLRRGVSRFQIAFSGDRIAATDFAGQSMVARWDSGQERWETDAESERRLDANRIDLRLCFAIAGDLAEQPRENRAVALNSEAEMVAAQQTDCRENVYITGRSFAWQRPLACAWAKQDANRQCGNHVGGLCDECCYVYDCACTCGPILSEFGCFCDVIGHPHWPGRC